ncbi:7216_t:CDS:10, partial [Ambispora leptoticha]
MANAGSPDDFQNLFAEFVTPFDQKKSEKMVAEKEEIKFLLTRELDYVKEKLKKITSILRLNQRRDFPAGSAANGNDVDLFDYANLLHEEIHVSTSNVHRASVIITINRELDNWLAEEGLKANPHPQQISCLAEKLGKINDQLINWEAEEKELEASDLDLQARELEECQRKIADFQERGCLTNYWKNLANDILGEALSAAKEEEDTITRLEGKITDLRNELEEKKKEIIRLTTDPDKFPPRRVAPQPPKAEDSGIVSTATDCYRQKNETLLAENAKLNDIKESLSEQVTKLEAENEDNEYEVFKATRDKTPLDKELEGYFPPKHGVPSTPLDKPRDFKRSYSVSSVATSSKAVAAEPEGETPTYSTGILWDRFYSTPTSTPLTTGSITTEPEVYEDSLSKTDTVKKKRSTASLTMTPIVEESESEKVDKENQLKLKDEEINRLKSQITAVENKLGIDIPTLIELKFDSSCWTNFNNYVDLAEMLIKKLRLSLIITGEAPHDQYELQEEINLLKTEIRDHAQRVGDPATTVSKAVNLINTLLSALTSDNYYRVNAGEFAEVRTESMKVYSLDKKIEQGEKMIKGLQADLKKLTERNRDLEEKIKVAEKLLGPGKNLTDLGGMLKMEKVEGIASVQDLVNRVNLWAGLDARIAELENKAEEAKMAKEADKNEVKRLTATLDRITKDTVDKSSLDELESENQELRESLEEIIEQLNNVEIKGLKNQLEGKEIKIRELEKQATDFAHSLEKEELEREKLAKKTHEDHNNKIQELTQRIAELAAIQEKLKHKVAKDLKDKETAHNKTKANLEAAERENNQIREEITGLRTEKIGLENEKDALKSAISGLEGKIVDLNLNLNETWKRVENLEKQNKELQEEIARLKEKKQVLSKPVHGLTEEAIKEGVKLYSSSGFLRPDGSKPALKGVTKPKSLEEVISGLKAKISSLESELATAKSNFDRKEAEVVSLNNKMLEKTKESAERIETRLK